jgi:hypothetical protein
MIWGIEQSGIYTGNRTHALSFYLVWFRACYNNRLCRLVVRVPNYRSGGPGFNSRRCKIFWKVMDLERRPLSLVSTTEELLERKSSCSSLESREYDRGDPSLWPRGALYPRKLALTSPTSGDLSVGIVRSRTKATELLLLLVWVHTESGWPVAIRNFICIWMYWLI